MGIRVFLIAFVFICGLFFIVFKWNEAVFIEKLTPFFPSRDENTPGYYADMISFVFSEVVWIFVLIAITIFFFQSRIFDTLYDRIEAALLKNTNRTLSLVFVIFTFSAVLIATLGLEQFPNSADEYAYLFQAQQLSEGKLWDNVHPQPEFFEFHHLAQKDGKWVGRFPPGWPMVLSLAYILHIPPFLINVILGLLALLVFFRLLRRLYDERIALWGTIVLAFSSFYIFNAASFFSHTVSLLEGLLFVYFVYRYIQTKKNVYVLVAGVFLGFLIMTRQLTAVIFVLPFIVYKVHQYKIKAFEPLMIMALGALPSVMFFLWYNYAITGNPFMPVTIWTNSDEALGFVKGHTPMKGLKFTFKRFMMFIYYASPSLLVLYFFFLLYRLKEYRKIFSHPEDYLFLLLVAGYFLYYHSGGNQYGPRFYLEGMPFLVAFVVVRTLRTNHRWAKVFLLCGLMYNIVKIPFIAYREHAVIEERKDVYAQVEAKNIHNAVVFISSETGIKRPMPVEDLNRNDRYYKNDVLFARDLGLEKNELLMRFYKGKEFYLYRREVDVLKGELIKLDGGNTPSQFSGILP